MDHLLKDSGTLELPGWTRTASCRAGTSSSDRQPLWSIAAWRPVHDGSELLCRLSPGVLPPTPLSPIREPPACPAALCDTRRGGNLPQQTSGPCVWQDARPCAQPGRLRVLFSQFERARLAAVAAWPQACQLLMKSPNTTGRPPWSTTSGWPSSMNAGRNHRLSWKPLLMTREPFDTPATRAAQGERKLTRWVIRKNSVRAEPVEAGTEFSPANRVF